VFFQCFMFPSTQDRIGPTALRLSHQMTQSGIDPRPDSLAAYYRRQAQPMRPTTLPHAEREQRDTAIPAAKPLTPAEILDSSEETVRKTSTGTDSTAAFAGVPGTAERDTRDTQTSQHNGSAHKEKPRRTKNETPDEYRARHARIAEQNGETPAEYAARRAKNAEKNGETQAEYRARRARNAEEKRQRLAKAEFYDYEDDYDYGYDSSHKRVVHDDYDRPRGETMHDENGNCVYVRAEDMQEFRRRN